MYLRASARAVAAVVLGLIAGLAVSLSIASYRATVARIYVHSVGEVVGWLGVPILLAPLVGLWLAFRLQERRFWRLAAGVVVSVVAGTGVGALAGAILGSHPSAPWAGALMGAGVGVLVLGATVVTRSLPAAGAVGSVALLLLLLSACGRSAPAPDARRVIPDPDPERVDAAIFLLGDPGLARADTYPILPRLRSDIERWSEAIGEDGDVVLLVLGDILYPEGLNAADHPSREEEVRRLTDQIELVSGPAATRVGARIVFLAGNHDWGQQREFAGAVRLLRLQGFLDDWQGLAAGRLSLEPAPGTGGPGVIDLGERSRLILLDTAWWLLGSDAGERNEVMDGVREALATADERRVILAAHHPLRSGGPHGAAVELGRYLGLRYLLNKAGILLQDLGSRPYSGLRRRLLEVFAEAGRPDIYVGGHEHSLQVFAAGETESYRALVVGSGSKLTPVGNVRGMLFGRAEPGYGTVFVLGDGSLQFRLDAAPAHFLRCDPAASASCMQDGVDAFRTVWAETIEPTR